MASPCSSNSHSASDTGTDPRSDVVTVRLSLGPRWPISLAPRGGDLLLLASGVTGEGRDAGEVT